MNARSVSLGSMFSWVGDSFRLLWRHFPTLMAASGLTLLLGLALFLPMLLIVVTFAMPGLESGFKGGALPLGEGAALFYSAYAVTVVAMLLLFPPLLIGWNRLCRDLNQGNAARALDILQPYRDRPLWLRSLGFVLIAVLLYAVVIGVFCLAFFGAISDFMQQAAAQQAAAAAGAAAAPSGLSPALVLGYFGFLGVMLILQFVYMVGFTEISLRETTAVSAMRRAAGGVLRNVLKLLVFLFCLGLLALIALFIVAAIIGLVIGVLSLLSPALAMALAFVLYLPFLLCIYPLVYASHYFVWKSMLGDASPTLAEDSASTVQA